VTEETLIASAMSSNTFISMVEQRISDKGMSYLEAIADVCEKTGLEAENVSKLMTPSMRKLLSAEATILNLLKRTGSRLPI
jgi:Phage late-transcription coactivator